MLENERVTKPGIDPNSRGFTTSYPPSRGRQSQFSSQKRPLGRVLEGGRRRVGC